MENQRVYKLIAIIENFKNTINEHTATKLELDKCKRIVERLSSFSVDCAECDNHFFELEKHMMQLKDTKDHLLDIDYKQHKQIIGNISSHLTKQHKLVTKGLYLGVYMSIGTSLGIVFGMVIFDNIALGLPIGIGLGVAIGAGLDADAKKKGLTL